MRILNEKGNCHIQSQSQHHHMTTLDAACPVSVNAALGNNTGMVLVSFGLHKFFVLFFMIYHANQLFCFIFLEQRCDDDLEITSNER